MSTVSDLLKNTTIPCAQAEQLIGDLLGISQGELFLKRDSLTVSPALRKKFTKIESELKQGTPLQYALSKSYFYGREFYINKNVLIPRPETELLVESAVNYLKSRLTPHTPHLSILDLGTGSGNIIISLYLELHSLHTLHSLLPTNFLACDISSAALKVARKNASIHGAKIRFIESDLFTKIHGRFDLITANLPYLSDHDRDLTNLSDPKLALLGGPDGSELIVQTISKLPDHLNIGGMAILEIGHDQGKIVCKSCKSKKLSCTIIKDLNGFERIALIKN